MGWLNMSSIEPKSNSVLSVLRQLGSTKTLWKLLKLYALFAVLNPTYKIVSFIWKHVRARRAWVNVPGERLAFGKVKKNVPRIHDFYADMILKHPRAPLIKTAIPLPELVCNTPEAVEWMLKEEFDEVTKPHSSEDYLFHLLGEFIGSEGIFITRHGSTVGEEDAKWYKQRKLASLIFTKNNFNNLMYDTFVEKAKILCSVLEKTANEGDKVDMQEKFFCFTMDSIEKIFFGQEVNSVGGQMSEYGNAFDEAHRTMLLLALQLLVPEVIARLVLPFPFGKLHDNANSHFTAIMLLARYLSPHNAEFTNSIKRLDKHVYALIDKTKKDPNLPKRRDLMALFTNTKLNDQVGMDDKTLRDVILNLTIAGRDTTACTLTWMFYVLCQNPDIQEKLCEEIDLKLQGRTPTPEDLDPENMPYLNGVLYETLRLFPPVPQDIKHAKKDMYYHDGTFVPKGTRLLFVPYAMGRNPEIYKVPLRVDPTRWIPFVTKKKTLYEFPVFQAGPRFCLGKDMAQFEAKLLSTILLQKFTFTLLEGEAENITYSLMITMSLCNSKNMPLKNRTHNLWLKPHRR